MDSPRPPVEGASVLDTSELRWFALGRPPREVIDAFSAAGTAGTTERRSDVYLVNGRHDLGLKRRSGWIVEAKQRQAVGPKVSLTAGLEAPLEEWRKWTPTEGEDVLPPPDASWIKVNKAILTRTFILGEGEVVGPASRPNQKLAGCDVEVAALTVGGIEAWTFALEAFGTDADRNSVISVCRHELAAESSIFETLGSRLDYAAGYPEYVDLLVSGTGSSDRLPRIISG